MAHAMVHPRYCPRAALDKRAVELSTGASDDQYAQQQTQELNQGLAAAEQRAVTAEQTIAAAQAGVGTTQAQPRTFGRYQSLGKAAKLADLGPEYRSLARQIYPALSLQAEEGIRAGIERTTMSQTSAVDEASSDHIYLQGGCVDTYAAARRIFTEYCEANREKEETVPMDLDLLQKGNDKGKGKGKHDHQYPKGKDKCKGKGKDQQAKGGKDARAQQQAKGQSSGSGQYLEGYCGSCGKWGHNSKNCRQRQGQTDAQRRKLRVMEEQASEETGGAVMCFLSSGRGGWSGNI
eukprot:6482553-Amphidinium_carterae.2